MALALWLTLAGLFLAPLSGTLTFLLQGSLPRARQAEGFSLYSACWALGMALGNGAAGALLGGHGARPVLALAALLPLALAGGLALQRAPAHASAEAAQAPAPGSAGAPQPRRAREPASTAAPRPRCARRMPGRGGDSEGAPPSATLRPCALPRPPLARCPCHSLALLPRLRPGARRARGPSATRAPARSVTRCCRR